MLHHQKAEAELSADREGQQQQQQHPEQRWHHPEARGLVSSCWKVICKRVGN